MFARILTAAALLAAAPAFAGTLPHGHALPDEVSMFENIRLTKAVGKVKGEGCEAALKAAWEDLDRVMGKNGTSTVVGVWTLNARDGWGFVPEVECEDAGKKQSVKIEALVIQEGSGPAYQKISGSRMLEIMSALQGDSNMMIGMRVAMMRTLDYQGELYYGAPTAKYEGQIFPKDASRNTRAVTVMREALLPQIQAMGNLLAAVPEFRGTEITATSQRYNQKMELVDETFSFRIGTEAAQKFFAGAISEQELIDQGAVLYADASKPPVKMDVSFVDAAD
ncbi:MAG: hypothetical protein H6736_07275 [Alphaproteobacteria bacterium]|nr:hypothetical protein [Alphaproteobacteria bacterium]